MLSLEQWEQGIAMAKVVLTYPFDIQGQGLLAEFTIAAPPSKAGYSSTELREELRDAEAVICLSDVQVDADLLSDAKNLKVVARVGVGFDNVDVMSCTKAGVLVTVTRGGPEEATADAAFGLIIAASRLFGEAERSLRAGNEAIWSFGYFRGRDVHNAILGLVGYGRIARAVGAVTSGSRREVARSSQSLTRFDYIEAEQSLVAERICDRHAPLLVGGAPVCP